MSRWSAVEPIDVGESPPPPLSGYHVEKVLVSFISVANLIHLSDWDIS